MNEKEDLEDNGDRDDESKISFKSDHRKKEEVTFGQKIIRMCYPGANASNIRNSFPLKYFSCCFNAPEEEKEINDLDSYNGNIYTNDENVDGVMSLFPSKYIRQYERKYLKFDKPNIINFFNKLSNDKNFIRKFEKFENFGLRMFMTDKMEDENEKKEKEKKEKEKKEKEKEDKNNDKDKNEIKSDKDNKEEKDDKEDKNKKKKEEKKDLAVAIPVTRCQIELPLELFNGNPPSVEDVGLAITDPDLRVEWDESNFKEYKIIKKLNQNTEILKIITNKTMQMIVPREFFEKRTRFVENGVFYSYSSSIPDRIHPPKKEPIRGMDYFGIFKVEADAKNILIDGFHQIDIKIGQPGPLIFMTLPLKMMNFTKALIEHLKK